MLIAHFKQTEFFNYLERKGCEKLNVDDFCLDEKVIVYLNPKHNITVPIQIQKDYYPVQVTKICEALNIKPPKQFKKISEQLKKLKQIQNKNK